MIFTAQSNSYLSCHYGCHYDYKEKIIVDNFYYDYLKKNHCLENTDRLCQLINNIKLFMIKIFIPTNHIEFNMEMKFRLGIECLKKAQDISTKECFLSKPEIKEIRRIIRWGGPFKQLEFYQKDSGFFTKFTSALPISAAKE